MKTLTTNIWQESTNLSKANDPVRYYAALVAPRDKRPALFVFSALWSELASIPAKVGDPHLRLIRYQWWRDTIKAALEGNPAEHPVLQGLSRIQGDYTVNLEAFDSWIEAWQNFSDARKESSEIITIRTHCISVMQPMLKLKLHILEETIPEPVLERLAGILGVADYILRFEREATSSTNPKSLPSDISNMDIQQIPWLREQIRLLHIQQPYTKPLAPILMQVRMVDRWLQSINRSPDGEETAETATTKWHSLLPSHILDIAWQNWMRRY